MLILRISAKSFSRQYGLLFLAILLSACGGSADDQQVQNNTVTIPELAGLEEGQAQARLEALGLTVLRREQHGDDQPQQKALLGDVIASIPAAGTRVGSGSQVTLLIASGLVMVPDLVGLPQQSHDVSDPKASAQAWLLAMGFAPPDVRKEYHAEFAAGLVVRQQPAAVDGFGQSNYADPEQDRFTLFVSLGAAPAALPVVPDLRGLSQQQALEQLQALELQLEFSENPQTALPDPVARGEVFAQEPPAGTAVESGSVVSVQIASGLIQVPDLGGLPRELLEPEHVHEAASNWLQNLGFANVITSFTNDNTVALDAVVRQVPEALDADGQPVYVDPQLTTVFLFVSLGAADSPSNLTGVWRLQRSQISAAQTEPHSLCGDGDDLSYLSIFKDQSGKFKAVDISGTELFGKIHQGLKTIELNGTRAWRNAVGESVSYRLQHSGRLEPDTGHITGEMTITGTMSSTQVCQRQMRFEGVRQYQGANAEPRDGLYVMESRSSPLAVKAPVWRDHAVWQLQQAPAGYKLWTDRGQRGIALLDPLSGLFSLQLDGRENGDFDGDGKQDCRVFTEDVYGFFLLPGSDASDRPVLRATVYRHALDYHDDPLCAGITEGWSESKTNLYGRPRAANVFVRSVQSESAEAGGVSLGVSQPPIYFDNPDGMTFSMVHHSSDTAVCAGDYQPRLIMALPATDFASEELSMGGYSELSCEVPLGGFVDGVYRMDIKDETGAVVESLPSFMLNTPVLLSSAPSAKQVNLNNAGVTPQQDGEVLDMPGYFNPGVDNVINLSAVNNNASLVLRQHVEALPNRYYESLADAAGLTLAADGVLAQAAAYGSALQLQFVERLAHGSAIARSNTVRLRPGVHGLFNIVLSDATSSEYLQIYVSGHLQGQGKTHCRVSHALAANASCTAAGLSYMDDSLVLALIINGTAWDVTLSFDDARHALVHAQSLDGRTLQGEASLADTRLRAISIIDHLGERYTKIEVANPLPVFAHGQLQSSAAQNLLLTGGSHGISLWQNDYATRYRSNLVFPLDAQIQTQLNQLVYDNRFMMTGLLAADVFRLSLGGHENDASRLRSYSVPYGNLLSSPVQAPADPGMLLVPGGLPPLRSDLQVLVNGVSVLPSDPVDDTLGSLQNPLAIADGDRLALRWPDVTAVPGESRWLVRLQVLDGGGVALGHENRSTRYLNHQQADSDLSLSGGFWYWDSAVSVPDITARLALSEPVDLLLELELARSGDDALRAQSQSLYLRVSPL